MKIITIKAGKGIEALTVQSPVPYEVIRSNLGFDSPFTIASRKIGRKVYDIYCDDEGLLKDKKYVTALCMDYPEVLCGDLLIAKHDYAGNTIGLTDKEAEMIMKAFLPLNPSAVQEQEDGDFMFVDMIIGILQMHSGALLVKKGCAKVLAYRS